MVKRLTGLLMLLCCIFSMHAQQAPQLPLNPNVKSGVLPNGMSYYILHNEEPKGRANFYIAQKVGSTLETKEQLGLAHFLEHMAFNGSTNFPGKSMLEYLQNKGMRFGYEINAYTSLDETVYRINQVPTNDVPLMDSVLLILHDWSSDLTLDGDEIEAERGVIQEEWRTRNSPGIRMYNEILPKIYEEYQYTQLPIGSMDVVMNFPHDVLREYYHKWYRPDQQGIIIVGDFDAAEMEKKVVALMSTINMPENPAERTYPSVSDNKELIYATFQDPEFQNPEIKFSIKKDKTPFEERSGLDYYVETQIAERLISMMINERLREMYNKPDCAFSSAHVDFQDYFISKTRGAFDISIVPKGDTTKAFEEALSEVIRACKTGFTQTELDRAKEELKSSFEKYYNERDKTDSHTLGVELTRHFIDNEPAPGMEIEWQLIQQIIPMLPLQAFNEAVKDLITPENQVLVFNTHDMSPEAVPSKEAMEGIIANAMNREYEAFVDDVVTEPLIAKLPKKGKITKTEELPQFGATKLTLSNGATVFVKNTDFAADQILFAAVAGFGKANYSEAEVANVNIMPIAFEASNLSGFSPTQLQKALAGKQVSSEYFLGSYNNGLSGVSNVKDLETLMQIIYLQFTNVKPNEESYAAMINRYSNQLANVVNTPDYKFSKAILDTRYQGNLLVEQISPDMLTKADYTKMLEMARQNLSNAADFDFIFVGNVDVATLTPLLEQYIASLPGKAKSARKRKNTVITSAKGQLENQFDFPMESPQTKEFVMISGDNVPYNIQNIIKLELIADILDIIYTRTLREEIGGTYGAGTAAGLDPRTGEWYLIYQYDTGAETKDALAQRAVSDIQDLFQNGATADDFNKVKEAAITQFGLSTKKNGYWLGVLSSYCQLGLENYTGRNEALRNLTLDELNAFMKNLYDGKNKIRVVLNGVQK
ncbi:MAG: insulinase family protein [Bacteroidales bacterium]|nr:insulinase family protein [Bacteroidales bacterium]